MMETRFPRSGAPPRHRCFLARRARVNGYPRDGDGLEYNPERGGVDGAFGVGEWLTGDPVRGPIAFAVPAGARRLVLLYTRREPTGSTAMAPSAWRWTSDLLREFTERWQVTPDWAWGGGTCFAHSMEGD